MTSFADSRSLYVITRPKECAELNKSDIYNKNASGRIVHERVRAKGSPLRDVSWRSAVQVESVWPVGRRPAGGAAARRGRSANRQDGMYCTEIPRTLVVVVNYLTGRAPGKLLLVVVAARHPGGELVHRRQDKRLLLVRIVRW